LDHRQLHGRQVVDGELVEARRQCPALLEPADALLHHRPAAVGLPIEPRPAVVGPLVLAARDDRPDAVPPQPAADARVTVALVPRQPHRAAARPPTPAGDADLIQDPLALRGLVPLAGRDLDRQGPAVAVADQVDFRAEAAAGATQAVVRRFPGR